MTNVALVKQGMKLSSRIKGYKLVPVRDDSHSVSRIRTARPEGTHVQYGWSLISGPNNHKRDSENLVLLTPFDQ